MVAKNGSKLMNEPYANHPTTVSNASMNEINNTISWSEFSRRVKNKDMRAFLGLISRIWIWEMVGVCKTL